MAEERYRNRRGKHEACAGSRAEGEAQYRASAEELGRQRVRALKLLAEAAQHIRRAKVRPRDLKNQCGLEKEQLIEWQDRSLRIDELIAGAGGAAVAGLGTAAAVYAAVGVLGVASTGTAISTLSGVAATNASLAALGGGSLAAGGGGIAAGTLVAGGLVLVPALMLGSILLHGKAEHVERQVDAEVLKMDEADARMEKTLTRLKGLTLRAEEMFRAIASLCIDLEDILRGADPSDRETTFQIGVIAVALAKLVDEPLAPESDNYENI